jgi:hypothetical protein
MLTSGFEAKLLLKIILQRDVNDGLLLPQGGSHFCLQETFEFIPMVPKHLPAIQRFLVCPYRWQ